MNQLISQNTSLFSNFIKNSIKAPSSKVQQNFMKVTSELAEVIKKICESEKLIFDVRYEGNKYWHDAKKHKKKMIDVSSITSSSTSFRKNIRIPKKGKLNCVS